jgi:DNA-binding transcriptional ArsR family regulator
MAKSGQQSKAKKGSGKARGAARSNGGKPYAEEDLLKAINHPLRRQILRILHASEGPVSPVRGTEEMALDGAKGGNLSSVSYHVTVLSGYKAIECVAERQVRGAMEHFYASQVADVAWLRGVLSRTQESDEARLWPKGKRPGGRNRKDGRAARQASR